MAAGVFNRTNSIFCNSLTYLAPSQPSGTIKPAKRARALLLSRRKPQESSAHLVPVIALPSPPRIRSSEGFAVPSL